AFINGEGNLGNGTVVVMNADGSRQRALTNGIDPVWSPDGRKIAFAAHSRDGYRDIYVINADGSGLRHLTHTPGKKEDLFPSWSPDGRTIAFARYRVSGFDDTQGDIYLINADGSGLRRLTRTRDSEDDPAWSPDGHWIAYTHTHTWWLNNGSTRIGETISQIYVMSANGVGQRSLTPDGDLEWSPSWRPRPRSA